MSFFRTVSLALLLMSSGTAGAQDAASPAIEAFPSHGAEVGVRIFSPPAGTDRSRSALVLFHGGGWNVGDASWMDAIATQYAALGMVAISVDYRLSGDGVTPFDAVADANGFIAVYPDATIVGGISQWNAYVDEVAGHAGTFDFILNTVAASHDLDGYTTLLKRDGTLCLVGVPEHPHPSPTVGVLIFGRKAIAGSLIGGIAETQEMLDFCAEKGIVSDIEMIAMPQIEDAYARMLKSDVKYRFVIDSATL